MNVKRLGVMLDCSRNAVMKPEKVKEYIDVLADLGYNCLMLYTEDTYEIKKEPYFGQNRGRYSEEEIRMMDAYAASRGVELIPCIQTLAHLHTIFRWPEYKKINDCPSILLTECDRTYELIDHMFETLSQTYHTKTVHVGMDEAHMLGRGKYQDLHGHVEHIDVFLRHLNKVSEIAKKYDFELMIWGDMFFSLLDHCDDIETKLAEIRRLVPDNVTLVYWDYCTTDLEACEEQMRLHQMIKEPIWFAGGLWNWVGFAPNNGYSIEATRIALQACKQQKVENVWMTIWGDNGGEASRFAILPSLYATAEMARGNTDMEEIKKGFVEKYGIAFDAYMLMDLPDTPKAERKEPCGPEKYLLYNDCFMGLFDSLIREDFAEKYALEAEKLHLLSAHPRFGRIFKTAEKLCAVHAIKCDLGVRTRNAYAKQDKDAMKELLRDYDKLLTVLEDFYEAFEEQWMWENKPHGFDVQDIRIGGVIRRVKHCRNRVEQYVQGKITRIEELEEPLLDVLCREQDNGIVHFNRWEEAVSCNRVFGS